jgi:hypothetical protein
MRTTEELVSGLVKEVTGSYETTFENQHGKKYNVDWYVFDDPFLALGSLSFPRLPGC